MGRRQKDKKIFRWRGTLAALATCTALLSFAGIAQAEAVTLGPALTGGTPGYSCSPAIGGGCGQLLLATDLPSVEIASPVDGTVVRWRVKGPSATPGYSLNVLRDNGDGTYTVTASTGAVTPAGNEIETLATSLPIQVGEYLELNIPQEGQFTALEGESTYASFFPVLQPGETREPANEFKYPFTFSYNADIEYQATPVTPPTPPGKTTPAPIVLSTPPPTAEARCVVPDLRGKKLSAAKRAVRAAGCGVGLIAKRNGVKAAEGEVIKQRPKPGRLLSLQTGISVMLR
jgi:outer membrane lipoprotein SlyB